MGKDNFNWKSLFINEENTSPPKEETTQPSFSATENRFPDTAQSNTGAGSVNNPFISEILDVYQKGFDSLNQEGFDFFEFYKSVIAVGESNPQSYQMAFTMGKSIKPELTREYLLEKSQYYIDEIEKVYAKYDSTGKARKGELDMNITRDKVNLTKSISDIETQIQQLQHELETKKIELSKLDTVNKEQYTEIQLKIEANNVAKQRIVDSIGKVINGIKQHL